MLPIRFADAHRSRSELCWKWIREIGTRYAHPVWQCRKAVGFPISPSPHPGGPLIILLAGRFPDFRRCCSLQISYLRHLPTPLAGAVVSWSLSFRSQWRGPRRHFTSFPHLPTNASNSPRTKIWCQARLTDAGLSSTPRLFHQRL
jgi:hypothetical protein